MKLRDDAKQQDVRYETAWRWFQDGKIKGHRIGARTIMIDEGREETTSSVHNVAVYARVSSAENRSTLDSQAERLVAYCMAKGYHVSKVVKEVGSFCARLYGLRRAKHKTETIVKELQAKDED